MANSLESLLAEGVISEIYGRLKSGKEAEVYAVAYGDEVVAAKVYKDRAQRSFKSNATYKEGRAVRNSRSQRAMDRGSKFGQEAAEDAWKAEEANALYKLHAAGVRVPKPVMFLEGVLFMELVRGADGQAAPRLIDTQLDATQAHAAYLDMLAQLVRILSCDLIHGDLSPYNVLWAESGATIIDFPQIVSAAQNSNSEAFFTRDARNILGHFADIDPSLRGRLHHDAREIWRAYLRRELTPDFLPTGRPPPPEARPRFEPRPREQFDGPRADRAPQPNRGPRDNGGAQPNRPPQLQMASARANIASQTRDGQRGTQGGPSPQGNPRSQGNPRPQNGNGPRPQNGNGPRPQNGNGPRPQNGNGPRPQNGNGPRPQNGNGPRPQNGNGPRPQNGNGPRPQNGNRPPGGQRPQRPQRPQQRGPEVIVLKRRAPDAPAGEPTERAQPTANAQHGDPPRDATRRPRRR